MLNNQLEKGSTYLTIGQVVKRLRESKCIRVCSLAKKAKIPYQTLQGIENGHVKTPGFDIVVKLSNALDVPLETFKMERRVINENYKK